jgi:hypothetical protein
MAVPAIIRLLLICENDNLISSGIFWLDTKYKVYFGWRVSASLIIIIIIIIIII